MRPNRPFLTASWRYLAMLNYDIDPQVLGPLVPRGTELDLWEGRALISLVGFRFLRTRVLGIPVPLHQNFDEINLRFYVRRSVASEQRHGVVFIREVVARAAIALVARVTYNEPYVTLPTRHSVALEQAVSGGPGRVQYQWRQDRWYTLEAETEGPPQPLETGSATEFLVHRTWGYTRQRDGSTIEYEVAHPRWQVWRAVRSTLDCDVARMFGPEFRPALSAPPSSALVARGSPVRVFHGREI